MMLDTEEEVKQVWSRGSYSEFAKRIIPMAGELVQAADVHSGDRVLDLGCGTGSVAITAARQGADVTGLDITPAMLEKARSNAELAGVDETSWHEGNAVDLPFEDDSLDVSLSSLGHMYVDPPGQAASEMARVTRPDGRIAFTSWTPTSLFPILAGLVSTHLPPPAIPDYTEPPFMWGSRDAVTERLGTDVEDLTFQTMTIQYPTLSPAHFWEAQTEHSGIFISFLEAVHDESALEEEVVETIEEYFDADQSAVELEYLLTTGSGISSN